MIEITTPATRTRTTAPAQGVHRTQRHSYYFNGEGPWPGVTSITKVLDAPALNNWRVNQVAELAIAQAERLIVDRQAGRVEGAMKYLTAQSSSARDRGTRIHGNVEAILQRQGFMLDPRDVASVDGARAWMNQAALERGFRPLVVEAYLINRTLGYGGTCDLIAQLDGEIWLLDWKTGSSVADTKGKLYRELKLQLSAYGNAEFIARVGDPERYPIPPITRYGIVHVTDGGTRLYEADVDATDWNAFRACLYLYAWRDGKVA